MSRRRVITIVILVATLVVAALALIIYGRTEPRYEGRTLSEWIDYANVVTYRGKTAGNPNWQIAGHAVQEMGSKAIPFMVKWSSMKDSKTRTDVKLWINSHRFLHWRIRSARERNRMAVEAFLLLGDKARPVWPGLLQWTYDPEPDLRLRGVEFQIATKADEDAILPVLRQLLSDPDKNVQSQDARMFHYYYPRHAELTGVYKLFPELKNAPTITTGTNQPAVR